MNWNDLNKGVTYCAFNPAAMVGFDVEEEGGGGPDPDPEPTDKGGDNPDPDPEGKPEWLPDKFFGQDGPNYENLAKSYVELEKTRVNPEELKERWEAERLEGRPEDADGYTLPEDERFDQDALAASPIVGIWRNAAHEAGLNQKQFEAVLTEYADSEIERVSAYAEKQKGLLGETADDRIKSVDAWAQKHFKGDQYAAISQIATTAAGVETLEEIMKMAGVTSPDNLTGGDKPGGGDTEEEILALMDTPAYYDPARKDPKVLARVQAFYAKQK